MRNYGLTNQAGSSKIRYTKYQTMGTTKQTIRFFWGYTRRYPRDFTLGFLNIIQSTINGVLTPLLLGFATAKLSNASAVRLSFGHILLLIGLTSLGALICNRIALGAINRYEAAATQDIANDIARHISYESYDFHTKNFSGALISKATKLGASYVTFMDTIMFDTLRNSTIVLFSIVVLSFYDLKLAGIVGILTAIGLSSTVYMTKKHHHLQKKATTIVSDQTAYLSDMITNAATVKTFAAEEFELKAYRKINQSYGVAMLKAWAKQLDANTMRMATTIAMYLAVLSYGIYGIQHNTLRVAVFIAAQLYCVRITLSFWDMSGIVRNMERVFADAHEMIEIMNVPIQLVDRPDAKELRIKKGELSFDHVTFRYPDAAQDDAVLKDFTLNIKPGEKIGLIGRSGGGKTTITKLILRFMDIQSGAILIDGQDIATVRQSDLRSSVSYVPQEPLLFHRTLQENISYGNQAATTAQIQEAARLSHSTEFIDELPQKYQTLVGERGIKLSGGQRQRIAIARAMLKDAPILVLDEATSALDSESEVLIQDALWKLMEGRTAIVIAHRLSTIQKMDRIIVMEKGHIAEQGTHKELIANKGIYAKLWAHQSGGFLED